MDTNIGGQRLALIIANEKGGVGKSTLALAIIDWLFVKSLHATVIQIDRQKRLSRALHDSVITIESDPRGARAAPEQELSRFSPVLNAVEAAEEATHIVIDVGAGEVGRFAEWASLVDLEAECSEFGLAPLIIVPFMAEVEAIRQARWTIERLRSAMPETHVLLVANERDGKIADLHPASDASVEWKQGLQALAQKTRLITLSRIPGGSWRHFEARGSRFVDIVDLDTASVMRITGLPRAEAKIARGDVAQFLVQVFAELDAALGAEGE